MQSILPWHPKRHPGFSSAVCESGSRAQTKSMAQLQRLQMVVAMSKILQVFFQGVWHLRYFFFCKACFFLGVLFVFANKVLFFAMFFFQEVLCFFLQGLCNCFCNGFRAFLLQGVLCFKNRLFQMFFESFFFFESLFFEGFVFSEVFVYEIFFDNGFFQMFFQWGSEGFFFQEGLFFRLFFFHMVFFSRVETKIVVPGTMVEMWEYADEDDSGASRSACCFLLCV